MGTNTPPQVGSMRSGLQQPNSVIGMSAGNIISNVRMASPYQAQASPRQYHLQDEFGNFEYAYANKDSEKIEKGNDVSVRGRYAYIMSDGVLRRVDYIADNNGFHVLQDNADKSRSQDRIKRSVEPNLIQARMTSFMDSSSLRDDAMVNPNVYNMMRQDMSNNMILRNRMGQDMMEENIMGRDIMDQNTYSNMMGRDMSSNLLNRNMMGQDMLNRNKMGQKMSTNMMGRDMSSNMMNTYVNDVNRLPLGQRNTMTRGCRLSKSLSLLLSGTLYFNSLFIKTLLYFCAEHSRCLNLNIRSNWKYRK